MIIEMCECNWGIGLTMPHIHVKMQWVKNEGGEPFWASGWYAGRYETIEVEEVQIHIPWKSLARELLRAA